MIDRSVSIFHSLLGLDSPDLGVIQMVTRDFVVYPLGIAFVRLARLERSGNISVVTQSD